MALESKLNSPQKDSSPSQKMTEEELDLQIAVLFGRRLLEDGGFRVIEKAAASSRDPGQVIGQFLMQMGQQMMESLPEDVQLSPTILLAEGGWVEQMSDYIQENLGIKREIMDRAEIYVASTAQQMAEAHQSQASGLLQASAAAPYSAAPTAEAPAIKAAPTSLEGAMLWA
jgi:hypothetical protein